MVSIRLFLNTSVVPFNPNTFVIELSLLIPLAFSLSLSVATDESDPVLAVMNNKSLENAPSSSALIKLLQPPGLGVYEHNPNVALDKVPPPPMILNKQSWLGAALTIFVPVANVGLDVVSNGLVPEIIDVISVPLIWMVFGPAVLMVLFNKL